MPVTECPVLLRVGLTVGYPIHLITTVHCHQLLVELRPATDRNPCFRAQVLASNKRDTVQMKGGS